MVPVCGVLLAGALVLGVVPAAARAVASGGPVLVSRAASVASVFGLPAPRLTPPPSSWDVPGLLLGLASAGLAAALALGAVLRRPDAVRAVLLTGIRALSPLRRLHSGHLGDYVLWWATGAAALLAVTVLLG
jgi:multicomponent Na+:H+ antiporter subunit D